MLSVPSARGVKSCSPVHEWGGGEASLLGRQSTGLVQCSWALGLLASWPLGLLGSAHSPQPTGHRPQATAREGASKASGQAKRGRGSLRRASPDARQW